MKTFFLVFLLMISALVAEVPSSSQEVTPSVSSEPVVEEPSPAVLDLEFVTVGDPGNKKSLAGSGAVKEVFQIGKYEVTAAQYCTFLNAVASKEDPHHLYKEEMSSDSKVASIVRSEIDGGDFFYSVIPGRENVPITYVSYFDAARFCNWLENGQPNIGRDDAATVAASTESGAYTFSFFGSSPLVTPSPHAKYSLPTRDQWIKAAYYKGGARNAGYWNFPTQHDDAPSHGYGDPSNQANYQSYYHREEFDVLTPVDYFKGTKGPYGTYDMGGNVAEWVSYSFQEQEKEVFDSSTEFPVNPIIRDSLKLDEERPRVEPIIDAYSWERYDFKEGDGLVLVDRYGDSQWIVGMDGYTNVFSQIAGGSWKSVYSLWDVNQLQNGSLRLGADPSQGSNAIGFRVAAVSDEVVSSKVLKEKSGLQEVSHVNPLIKIPLFLGMLLGAMIVGE